MENFSKKAMTMILLWIVVGFTCVMLIITGAINLSVESFAVDKNDRLYISTTNGIAVYEEGMQVGRISLPTSRGYKFTIQRNDTILLSTSTKVYILDLSGNILSQREDTGSRTFYQLQKNRRTFKSWHGDNYHLRGIFGCMRIIKNDSEVIFRTGALSAIVTIVMVFGWISVAVFIFRNTIKVLEKGAGQITTGK